MEKATTPYVTGKEREIMNRIFEGAKPKTVLEWGSGGSTIYFPKRFPFIERWVSIEHNPKWYNWVKENICSKVELRLRGDLDYYSEPVRLEEKFDMIFIDGKYRRMCLVGGKHLLTSKGFVLLHDSGRKLYMTAYRCYKVAVKLINGRQLQPDGYYDSGGLTLFADHKLPIIVSLDVDGTLEISKGPVSSERINHLKKVGVTVGFNGNCSLARQKLGQHFDFYCSGKLKSLENLNKQHPEAMLKIHVDDNPAFYNGCRKLGWVLLNPTQFA